MIEVREYLDADIAAAKGHWRDYKRRKRQEVT